MSQRDRIINIASSQVGYKEGNGDRTKYGDWYGMNGNPWCAMFVSWCAAQAQVPTSVIPKLAYVPYMVNFYRARGRFRARGSYTSQKGDIVFFGDSSHVGLVVGTSGNNVITIEGNTTKDGNSAYGEGVYRRIRPLGSGSWVMGFGVPAYEEDEVEVKEIKLKSLDTGTVIPVDAVNVDGANFIRLRDVEKFLPVEIGWDGTNPTFNLKFK